MAALLYRELRASGSGCPPGSASSLMSLRLLPVKVHFCRCLAEFTCHKLLTVYTTALYCRMQSLQCVQNSSRLQQICQQFMLRQDARHKPSERVDQRTARKDASPGSPCRGETVQKTPVQAGESGAGRGSCKPRNPPAVVECNTPKQEALLQILSKMQVNQLLQLCRKMNVDC